MWSDWYVKDDKVITATEYRIAELQSQLEQMELDVLNITLCDG
jgi:hypothetical protein